MDRQFPARAAPAKPREIPQRHAISGNKKPAFESRFLSTYWWCAPELNPRPCLKTQRKAFRLSPWVGTNGRFR
jgi:hypothetical protein